MPREPRSNCTIKATGRAGSPNARGWSRSSTRSANSITRALRVLESAHQNCTSLKLQDLELQLTKVRQEYPEFNRVHRKLSITTLIEGGNRPGGTHQPQGRNNPQGKPRQKKTEMVSDHRTGLPSTPNHPPQQRPGNPYLCIKGLPNLRIITHRDLPEDQQPSRVSITLRRHRISIKLTYRQPPYPKPKPVRELRKT